MTDLQRHDITPSQLFLTLQLAADELRRNGQRLTEKSVIDLAVQYGANYCITREQLRDALDRPVRVLIDLADEATDD